MVYRFTALDIDIDLHNLHIFEQVCLTNYIDKKAEEHEVTEMIARLEKETLTRLTRMDKRMEKRMDALGSGIDRIVNEMRRVETR